MRYVQRKFIFDITTAGAGTPTLAWEYHNGGAWTAVANLSDGTSGLTVDGTVAFDRPTDIVTQTIDSKTIYAIRCRIVSGSFSTVPQAVEIGSRTVSSSIDIQHYTVKNRPAGKQVGNIAAATFATDAAYIIDDYATVHLNEGETAATALWDGNNLAAWQALAKSKTTTDAEVDSVFGPNHTLVDP